MGLSMDSVWQDISYQPLMDLITSRVGLQFNDHRIKALDTLVEQMLGSGTVASIDALTQQLLRARQSDAIWQQVIQALTIGETYFFRNQAHMAALRMHVLPALIQTRRTQNQKFLRIWSAGCATGEEPYSLAMLLRELIPDIEDWSITLLATDVNIEYLDRAREGIYRAHSFRGETPEWLQNRWFTPVGNGFRIHESLRRMVRFSYLNLISDTYPDAASGTMNMDIVVCRNVTIYFSREQTQAIVDRFFETLATGGWLIVGHSEPQPGVYQRFESRNFENAIFYQKAGQPLPVELLYNPHVSLETFGPELPLPALKPKLPPVPPPRPNPVPASPAPVSVSTLLEQARLAANNEHWDEAFRLLEEAGRKDVLQPQVHYLRALIHIQKGDWLASLTALRQAVYCDPTFALAHYTLGDLHARTGALEEAARHWRRAQKSLIGLDNNQLLPLGDDMTVGMLHALLDYRLQRQR